jgi:colanic acid/amylovoran biosynthesis protein
MSLSVELRSATLANKGGELLLCAVLQHFIKAFPDARIAVSPSAGSYIGRSRYGVFQKWRSYGRWSQLAKPLMTDAFCLKYGILKESVIDVMLDISGFAYGDQWGAQNARELERQMVRWARPGKVAVLLPQSLGPFQDRGVRDACRDAFAGVNAVYARDRLSLAYAEGLGLGATRLDCCPDITVLVDGRPGGDFDPAMEWACIVPNVQMIRMRPGFSKEEYLQFLCQCVRNLQDRGVKVFLLVHEEGPDEGLAKEVNSRLGCELPIHGPHDALSLKWMIGRCRLVIGSRFHALVSALSQSVPALATSWSHKYQSLFEEFGCPDCVVKADCGPEILSEKIGMLLDENTRATMCRHLSHAAWTQRKQVEVMWEHVDDLIRNR